MPDKTTGQLLEELTVRLCPQRQDLVEWARLHQSREQWIAKAEAWLDDRHEREAIQEADRKGLTPMTAGRVWRTR